ncbi:MAG: response regulator [Burkholderiaceae bacterium]
MSNDARILVATDVTGDADLVRRLLQDEFNQVSKSVDPDLAVQDFETYRPNVLMLAFNSLEKAEVYCLGLYRLSSLAHALEHRTIILCNTDELQKVYALCRKEFFDDYVLFWPVGHDAPRLCMAVHHALRRLAISDGAGPTVAEFASQARKLAGLELQIEQYVAQGAERFELASDALEGGQEAASALAPVRGWASGLKDELSPGLEAIRQLQALAERVRPAVLLVDDDEFQHKLLRRLMMDAGCDLISALTGADALAAIRNRRPDLILMDVQLPDVDGIELTRSIRASERFAAIPVLMLTGQSDKNVVVQSIKAGASGFLVKPFNKDLLLTKISAILEGVKSSGAI